MSGRSLRVNELIMREVSTLLHTFYRDDAVYITVTEVSVAPDLRRGTVFYATLGDESKKEEARKFFNRYGDAIRLAVGKVVRLKYLPHLQYKHDESIRKGVDLVNRIDDIVSDED